MYPTKSPILSGFFKFQYAIIILANRGSLRLLSKLPDLDLMEENT